MLPVPAWLMRRETLLLTPTLAVGASAVAAWYPCAKPVAGKPTPSATTLTTPADHARRHGVGLRSIALDVQDARSISDAVATIIAEHGRLDGLIQNAGHMDYGPLEAFTPEQLTVAYDVNVLGTQRVNRAVRERLKALASTRSLAPNRRPLRRRAL